MSRLAIYASTVGAAVTLAEATRDAEATRQAHSVAVTALDYATAEARDVLEAELRGAGKLGAGVDQFPGSPWPLWENQRIFRLLKSADLDQDAVEALRGLTVEQLAELSPASILALLGAPHRPIGLRALQTGAFIAAGLAVGSGLVVLFRRHYRGSPWHV